MSDPVRTSAPRRTFAILIAVLAATLLLALALAFGVWTLLHPPAADGAQQLPAQTASPTPRHQNGVPTLAAVTDELLVCQRQVARALNARQLAAAAALLDDRTLRLRWVSMDWTVDTLNDALPGVILGLDAALEAWQEGCAVYDRVEIEVYDRRPVERGNRTEEGQIHQLTVQATLDDLLDWRAGTIGDRELLDRLEVTRTGEH